MKTVMVTGAAQGLGLTLASLLAQRDHRVILVDVQPLDGQARTLRAAGGQIEARSGSIACEEFVTSLSAWVFERYGALDGLVNNAGVSLIQAAEDTTTAQWQRVMDVNLRGPFLLCRSLGAEMLKRRAGSIVNVASVAGLSGIIHRAAYNASKHGLIGLTRTLAAEWGGRGVRVNAVCPGWIKTEMDEADQGSGAYSDADIVNRVPMGRFASPQDVAEAIMMLLDSQRSAFINGVCLPVDGGWTADGSWDALRLRTR